MKNSLYEIKSKAPKSPFINQFTITKCKGDGRKFIYYVDIDGMLFFTGQINFLPSPLHFVMQQLLVFRH